MPPGKIPQPGDDWRKLGDRPATNLKPPIDDPEDIQDNDIRDGYRIVRCCGNCKFYWYMANNTRRGCCTFPDKRGHNKDRSHYQRYPGTHSTCTCDNHRFRGKGSSLYAVTNYCGAEFFEDE